ncbi:MAG: hypothetical protein J7L45_01620 [Candidatus Aenigmarchaeota archaeon]|nr:hypothetical protein [Candidatus Aenigmarchaeota archaeon]
MKDKLNRIFVLSVLFILILPTISRANYVPEQPSFRINQLKYDPYPAEPGKYVTVWFEVYNTGTETAKNVTFVLEPEYPFSIDPNEDPVRKFSSIPGLFDVVLKYKIRVDSNAVDGDNPIKIRYKIGNEDWVESESYIYVSKAANIAELEPIFSGADPTPTPGSETTVKIDIANIAPGSAYYTIVEANSPIADIPINKVFVGTLDADDFETVEFKMKIKENVTPGTYPIHVTTYYKDENYEKAEMNKTVYFKVYSKEEIKEIEKTPWYVYLVYLIIIIAVLKYAIVPIAKNMKKRKK